MEGQKGIALIPAILAVLVLVALGILASNLWNPSWDPFLKTSNLTIEKAIAKLAETKSFKVDGKINLEIESQDPTLPSNKIKINAGFIELVDKKNVDEPKTSFDINLSGSMEGLTVQMTGNVITVGNDVFFKITQLPIIPGLTEGLEGVKDQWFNLKKGESSDKQKLEEKEIAEEFKKLIAGKEIFEIKKNLGKENIAGKSATHYLTGLKKDTMKVLLPKLFEMAKRYVPEDERVSYEKELNQLLQKFNEGFDILWSRIAPLDFDFWIDNGTLRRVKFEKEVEPSSFDPSQPKGKLKIMFDFTLSDFDKTFKIEAPKNFKPFDEFLSIEVPALPGGELNPEDLKGLEELKKFQELQGSNLSPQQEEELKKLLEQYGETPGE
jgi:hypothetical protein